jgi:preprotein translocase subunit SecG
MIKKIIFILFTIITFVFSYKITEKYNLAEIISLEDKVSFEDNLICSIYLTCAILIILLTVGVIIFALIVDNKGNKKEKK